MRQEALFGEPKELPEPTSRSAHFATGTSSGRLGELPKHDPKTGQLPLLMTAREIRHHYRALDGDREDIYSYKTNGWSRDEHDDELFDRKYEEAQYAPEEYGHLRTSPESTGAQRTESGALSSGESLADRLYNSNYELRNPISLQFHDQGPANPREGVDLETNKEFVDPRPQILGGHHRVAVLDVENPNKLLPVMHHATAGEAQKTLGMRY